MPWPVDDYLLGVLVMWQRFLGWVSIRATVVSMGAVALLVYGLTALAEPLAKVSSETAGLAAGHARPDVAKEAIDGALAVASQRSVAATVLMFADRESGSDVYPTRVVLSDGFLRIDYGQDDGDFVLFDRQSKAIFNVVHDQRTVLEIPRIAVPSKKDLAVSMAIQAKTRSEPLTDAPKVDGVTVASHDLLINGRSCVRAMVLPGYRLDVSQALFEYAQTLAGQQAATLNRTPEDMQTACGLALHIFEAGFAYREGLPVRVADEEGRVRVLTNVDDDVEVKAELFVLPSGYHHYGI